MFRTLLVGMLSVGISGLVASAEKPATEWPLFRGDPAQTGVVTADLPDKLEVRWEFETKDSIKGTAAIVKGVVYIGSMDEHLYALDLATGKEKWKYKAGPFEAPPSVHGDAVYIGDSDGVFHCVDAATGKKRWTFASGAQIVSGANFADGKVLFGSHDETLYCLTGEGKEAWKFKIQGPVNGSPAIADGKTFVAGCDSILHVLDVKTGKELSSVDLDGQAGATPAVRGEELFVGTMTNQFKAINWKKSEVLWTFEAEKRSQPFYASAAATEKLIIASSRDKKIYALDRKTGNEVWGFATGRRTDSSPVVVGKRVYVGSEDECFYVLDLEKGTQLQKLELGGAISSSAAVAEGCLVIGTEKGIVYCFGNKK